MTETSSFAAWESPLDLETKRPELGEISLAELAAIDFDKLGQFKQAEVFPHGYDRDYLTFYAPRDTGVHQVLLWTLLQAKGSVAINMYGFDDPQLVAVLRHHSENPLMVIDGLYLVTGSTNWSFGGETEQDNQLTLTRDPIACAEARAVIDLDHDVMLKQMAEALAKKATKKG